MTQNENLAQLSKAGVAVWLDDLSRDRIRSGNLQSLVDDHSVVGVTTNPSIFAAAISGSDSYDDQLHALAVRKVSVEEALRTITAADVRDACDLLAPVAARTGRDGRVSLEVAPGLANDTDATAAEAAHLWWLVDRPNLFIKIPATEAGLPAITTSIARGISVNVTLIFSLERYRAVMDAYLAGLEHRLADDPDASFEGI
jgi:transaldolase